MEMKRMCKAAAAAILAALAFVVCAQGGVPLEWAATPGRPAPAQFDRFHGEALELRCEFRGFDPLPFEAGGDVRLWWQTNGMGNAWWSIPATVSSNALSAVWGPAQDPGAERVTLFFGAPSNAYAAASLRLRGSPGGAPNALEPPSVVDWTGATNAIYAAIAAVDAAWREGTNGLASVEYVQEAISAAGGVTPEMVTNAAGAAATNAVTNIVTKSYVEGLGIAADVSLAPATNYTDSAIGEAVRTNYLCTVAAAQAMTNAAMDEVRGGYLPVQAWNDGIPYLGDAYFRDVQFDRLTVWESASFEIGFDVGWWADVVARREGRSQTLPDYLAERENAFEAAKVAPVAAAVETNTADVAQLKAESSIVYRLVTGTNVVCEVTNYNSQVHAPEMRLLQLDPTNGYFVVWAETNGLERTRRSAQAYTDGATGALWRASAEAYAPRAWSRTTAGLGADAPEGVTWISTPQTVIAGGYEYAQYVTSAGSVWVLCGNGMVDLSGTTNGFFRISDADGNPVFSVESSASYVLGVDSAGISVAEDGTDTVVTVPVNVVSAAAPTASVCTNLQGATWWKESDPDGIPAAVGSVSWSGASGEWVCTARFGGPKAFLRFEVLQEGGTIIKQSVPMDASGGILCTDGIHKVRPVYNAGSVTWEVVP